MNLVHVYQALFPSHPHESLGTRLTYNSASDTIDNSGGVGSILVNNNHSDKKFQLATLFCSEFGNQASIEMMLVFVGILTVNLNSQPTAEG